MELLKLNESPARFPWKDVVFLYRTKVTTEDKFAIDMAGTVMKDGRVEFTVTEFYRTLVKTFVIGWEGVTDGAKPVPYSYDAFTRLPSDPDQDVLFKLAIKIGQDTGFLTTPEQKTAETELKNG